MSNTNSDPAVTPTPRRPIQAIRQRRPIGQNRPAERPRSIAASRLLSLALLLLPALVLVSPSAAAQTVTAVPSLDLEKFLGTWHELAHYPNKPEKACVGDAVALYTARYKPKQFALVTSCQTGSGPSDGRNANGKMGKTGDGRLVVSRFWPFTQKRWVLALGPAYDWALVGSPNHKSLWILSRTPTLKPEVLADIKSRAAAQGFDPAKLIMLPRS